ncbi:MAG: hypothetical protein K2R98_18520 [Gemmataceae bacterium]|nr:hypothetical protein [Gemmataceae bacterium]
MSPADSPANLAERYRLLRHDTLEEFERTAARENYWLIYTLLGWTNLLACAVSHYFVEVMHLQAPNYGPFVLLWAGQIVVALGATTLAGGSWKTAHLPLLAHVNRLCTVFVLLCWNVAVLNVLLGLPIFVLLPALATLSSFMLLVLSMMLSARLVVAALAMFVTGSLMAFYPRIGFLLYGAGWLLVLQTAGVIFFRKRRCWLGESGGHDAIRPVRRGEQHAAGRS